MPKHVSKSSSSAGGRNVSRTSTLKSDCQPPTKKLKSLSFTVLPGFAFKKPPKVIDSSPSRPLPHPSPSPVDHKSKGKQRETSGLFDEGSLWVDKYEPVTTEELVVHNKKVDDVRQWFMEALNGGKLRKYRRILALTGPAGSGKTATVKVLAKELGFELIEWNNSMTNPYGEVVSQLDKFREFLARASTSRSVFEGSSSGSTPRQVILLEDLPNILHIDTRDKFQDILRLFAQRQTSQNGEHVPLVVIVSDSGARGEIEDTGGSSSFQSRSEVLDIRSVLPVDLLSGPCVTHISFNPVAPTLMMKTLQALVSKHFQDNTSIHLTKNMLDMIVTCSRGDIRGAVMELQLFFLANKRTTKKGKKNGLGDPVALLRLASQREQSLALFHLLGRVLYNKRKGDPPSSSATRRDREQLQLLEQNTPDPEELPPHLKSHHRKASLVDVNTLYADSPIDSSLFSLYLHQNYHQFCEKLEECGAVAEWMSWTDFSGPEEWFQANPHRFHLLALGTLHSLPIPVPRRSQKMFKPEFFEQLKKTREASDAVWAVSDWFNRETMPVCGRWGKNDLACEAGIVLSASSSPWAKVPQSHNLFSRLAFDDGEYLPSQLEEDECTPQGDLGEEYTKQDSMPGDEIADGGWLEGDDIEDF